MAEENKEKGFLGDFGEWIYENTKDTGLAKWIYSKSEAGKKDLENRWISAAGTPIRYYGDDERILNSPQYQGAAQRLYELQEQKKQADIDNTYAVIDKDTGKITVKAPEYALKNEALKSQVDSTLRSVARAYVNNKDFTMTGTDGVTRNIDDMMDYLNNGEDGLKQFTKAAQDMAKIENGSFIKNDETGMVAFLKGDRELYGIPDGTELGLDYFQLRSAIAAGDDLSDNTLQAVPKKLAEAAFLRSLESYDEESGTVQYKDLMEKGWNLEKQDKQTLLNLKSSLEEYFAQGTYDDTAELARNVALYEFITGTKPDMSFLRAAGYAVEGFVDGVGNYVLDLSALIGDAAAATVDLGEDIGDWFYEKIYGEKAPEIPMYGGGKNMKETWRTVVNRWDEIEQTAAEPREFLTSTYAPAKIIGYNLASLLTLISAGNVAEAGAKTLLGEVAASATAYADATANTVFTLKNGMETAVALSNANTLGKLANVVAVVAQAKPVSVVCGVIAETFAESITGNPDKFWDVINSGQLTPDARAQLWEDFVGNSVGLAVGVGMGKALIKAGETIPGRVISANISLKLNKLISKVSPEYRQILAKAHGVEDVADYIAKLRDNGKITKADVVTLKSMLNDVRKAATDVDSIKWFGRSTDDVIKQLEEVESSLNDIRKIENAIDEFNRKGVGIASEWYNSGKYRSFEGAAKELDDAYDALRKTEKSAVSTGLKYTAKSAISDQATQYINSSIRLQINANIQKVTKDAHKLHQLKTEEEFLESQMQIYKDAVNQKTLDAADLVASKVTNFYANANNLLMKEGLLNNLEIEELRQGGMWGNNGELYAHFIREKETKTALTPLKINMLRKETAGAVEHYQLGSTDKFLDPLATTRVYMRRYADLAARQNVAKTYISAVGGELNSEVVSAAQTEAARIANKANITQSRKETKAIIDDVSEQLHASGLMQSFVEERSANTAANKAAGRLAKANEALAKSQTNELSYYKAGKIQKARYAMSIDDSTVSDIWTENRRAAGKPGESVLQYVKRKDNGKGLTKSVRSYVKENYEVAAYVKGDQLAGDVENLKLKQLKDEKSALETKLNDFLAEYAPKTEDAEDLEVNLTDLELEKWGMPEGTTNWDARVILKRAVEDKQKEIDAVEAAEGAKGPVDTQRYALDNAKRYSGVQRTIPEAKDGTNLLKLQKDKKALEERLASSSEREIEIKGKKEVINKDNDKIPPTLAGRYGLKTSNTMADYRKALQEEIDKKQKEIDKLNKAPRQRKMSEAHIKMVQEMRDAALRESKTIYEALQKDDMWFGLTESEKKELLYDLVGKENGDKIWAASQPKALGRKRASYKAADGSRVKIGADIPQGTRKVATGVSHTHGEVTEEGQKFLDSIDEYSRANYQVKEMRRFDMYSRENFNYISSVNPDFEPTLQRLIIGNEPDFADTDRVTKGTQQFYKETDIAKKAQRVAERDAELTPALEELGISQETYNKVMGEGIDKFIDKISSGKVTEENFKALAEYYGIDEADATRYFSLKVLHNNKKAMRDAIRKQLSKELLGLEPNASLKRVNWATNYLANKIYDAIDDQYAEMSQTISAIAPALVDQQDLYSEVKHLSAVINAAEKDTNNIVAIQDNMGRVSLMQTSPLVASLLNHDAFQAPMTRMQKINYFLSKTFRLGTTSLNVTSLINQTFRDFGNAFIGGNLYRTWGRSLNEMRSVLGDDVVDYIRKEDAILADNISEYAKAVGRDESDVAYELIRNRGKAISPTTTETDVYKRALEVDSDLKVGKQSRGILDTSSVAYKGMMERIDRIGNKLGWMNEVRETGLRNAVYNNAFADAVKRGYSYGRAKDYADFLMNNATTNFGRTTEMFANLQRSVPFLGAAINGTKSFYRLLLLDPVGVTGRLIGGIVLPTAYLTAKSLEDKKSVALWKDIKEYEKNDSIVFIVDGQIMSIPVPQEISSWINPIRHLVEKAHGANRHTYWQLAINDMLGVSPVDLDGFANIDQYTLTDGTDNGGFFINNIEPGLAKMFSQLAPVPLKATVMAVTGIDPYTMKKIDRSYKEVDLDTGQSVTKGDYSGKLSKLVANFVTKHTPFELSAPMAEKLLGQIIGTAPVKYSGWLIDLGQGVVDKDYALKDAFVNSTDDLGKMITGPITVDHYRSEAENAWKYTVNQLYAEREALMTSDEWQSYMKKRRNASTAEELEKLKNVRENLVSNYYDHITKAVDNLQKNYGSEFTAEKYASVLSLSTLDVIGADVTVYGQEVLSDLYQDAKAQAVDTLYRQGFTSPTTYSAFGYLDTKEDGTVEMKYATPMAILEMKNTVYRSDELDRANTNSLLNRAGLQKNGDAYNEMQAAVDAIYAKGNLSSDDYDAINDIYKQWDANVLVTLYPYIEQRGVDVFLNDSKTIDLLDDVIKVPSDFMKTKQGRYFSSPGLNKQRGYAKSYFEYIYNKLEGND